MIKTRLLLKTHQHLNVLSVSFSSHLNTILIIPSSGKEKKIDEVENGRTISRMISSSRDKLNRSPVISRAFHLAEL